MKAAMRMSFVTFRAGTFLAGLFLIEGTPLFSALAGPPFNTDFAEPIGYGRAELDLFSGSTHVLGDTSATLPGVQVDYGALPNLQLRAILPVAFDKADGRSSQYGIGDLTLGMKYRFVQERDGAWWPQVSVFPLVLVPTGDRVRGLGQGHATYSLPIWLQKNFGPWTTYGGGGYSIESGAHTKNSWFAGWAVLRKITRDLALGGEVFYKEARLVGAPAGTSISLGGAYDLTERYHIYFAVSRGIQNASANNKGTIYGALAMTF